MNNLNLQCPINPLGYGQASLNLLLSLSKLYNVALWPIGNIALPDNNKPIEARVKKAIDNQSVFDVDAPSLRIWHQFDMAQHIGSGQHVGMPIFELNKFDSREKHHLSSLDKIFVCSKWAADVVYDQLSNPHGSCTHVVPLGVDRSIFHERNNFFVTDAPTPYRFLNIGKWEIRKGHDIIIEAFCKAFDKSDNVELWMMNHNPFLSDAQTTEWQNLYKNSKLGDKVKFIDRVKTNQEVADIMRKADCGVFPARAEGWNLELLEMMSCGKPVIATNYSAHTEFCSEANCNLIEPAGLEEAWDGIWFKGQGEWAALDSGSTRMLSSYMRKEFEAGPRVNAAGIETAKQFSWGASADAVQKGLG